MRRSLQNSSPSPAVYTLYWTISFSVHDEGVQKALLTGCTQVLNVGHWTTVDPESECLCPKGQWRNPTMVSNVQNNQVSQCVEWCHYQCQHSIDTALGNKQIPIFLIGIVHYILATSRTMTKTIETGITDNVAPIITTNLQHCLQTELDEHTPHNPPQPLHTLETKEQ